MFLRSILITSLAMTVLGGCQTSPSKSATLYDDLGGNEGLEAIVQRSFHYTLQDERIADKWENSNVERVQKILVQQLCDIADGPCTYTGQSMARVHSGLGLTSFHFNALVENFQKSMDDNKIPYRTQNRLLARLASMHDDVVKPLRP